MKRFSMIAVAVLVITSMLAAACAAPTPERIVETVVVVETVEVEKMVEGETVTVVETVEVEVVKEVEKEVVVTPTPEPAPEQGMIGGFPTSVQLEADTGQAAFDAADKGEPDPAPSCARRSTPIL
jgi:hypothetical protein